MSFKISLTEQMPDWDSLPVAKITNYPLEPRDYKPFAQVRLCVSPQSLWVRLWAFEAIPTDTSTLMVRLNLFPDLGERFISLSAAFGGEVCCEVVESESTVPMAQYQILPKVKRFTSEDLQGQYWGVVFELPLSLMKKLYGEAAAPAPGGRVTGNFYKLDRSDCGEHYGSFYPVDFSAPNALSSSYFGEFELVNY